MELPDEWDTGKAYKKIKALSSDADVEARFPKAEFQQMIDANRQLANIRDGVTPWELLVEDVLQSIPDDKDRERRIAALEKIGDLIIPKSIEESIARGAAAGIERFPEINDGYFQPMTKRDLLPRVTSQRRYRGDGNGDEIPLRGGLSGAAFRGQTASNEDQDDTPEPVIAAGQGDTPETEVGDKYRYLEITTMDKGPTSSKKR